tara:strand:+ start:4860 stop:6311 length:1452 start_codon:yes stop_codon:yes gene_type:complete
MKILTAFISLLYLTLLLLGVFALSKPSIAVAEDLTTSNLTPNMSDMTASGGTSVGTGSGCGSGQYCTSGTTGGGGTYTSTFDVPLTEAELRQGFTLNSGITINSHSSNSRLPTCANGLLQSGDCRDVFKLTITLKDNGTAVETFVHQEELNWTGLKDFTYADTVGTNSYGVLTGVFELYGIDAGYPHGYYGPQFSNPSLTIDYQTALVIEETITVINEVIQTDTEATIMDAATGGTDVTPPTTVATVAIPALQAYTNTASITPVDTPVDNSPSSSSVFTPPVDTASASTETTIASAPVIETAAVAPTIAPVAQQTETQQAEETQAEAQIETAMAPQPAAAETTETAAAEPSETTEAPSPAKAAAKTKSQKAKPQRKTVSNSTTVVVPVAVPVTAAVAAQTVVNNIAPSQKYGNTAQTVTLVAMGMIANNKGLFKTSSLPDTPKFFSNSSVPDGPSMVDRMTNYQVFGTSNSIHDALVESQWRN